MKKEDILSELIENIKDNKLIKKFFQIDKMEILIKLL